MLEVEIYLKFEKDKNPISAVIHLAGLKSVGKPLSIGKLTCLAHIIL